MKTRTLEFYFRGQQYLVNEQGRINANGIGHHSEHWVFLGGSSHHWHNPPTVSLREAFAMPGLLDGCLGWDIDHGTTRQWGGSYYGKLPRITRARVIEMNQP